MWNGMARIKRILVQIPFCVEWSFRCFISVSFLLSLLIIWWFKYHHQMVNEMLLNLILICQLQSGQNWNEQWMKCSWFCPLTTVKRMKEIKLKLNWLAPQCGPQYESANAQLFNKSSGMSICYILHELSRISE